MDIWLMAGVLAMRESEDRFADTTMLSALPGAPVVPDRAARRAARGVARRD